MLFHFEVSPAEGYLIPVIFSDISSPLLELFLREFVLVIPVAKLVLCESKKLIEV